MLVFFAFLPISSYDSVAFLLVDFVRLLLIFMGNGLIIFGRN